MFAIAPLKLHMSPVVSNKNTVVEVSIKANL